MNGDGFIDEANLPILTLVYKLLAFILLKTRGMA